MKLLYIGTVSESREFERIVKESKIKPSVAPQTFETAFLNGVRANGVADAECFTFPMIASFPGSKLLFWLKKKQTLECGFPTTWIPTVNLPILKMLFQGFSSKKMLKAWLKKQENPEDVCIVLYSIYEPIAKNIIRLRKKYHFKTVAFVPDLPEHMYATKRGLQGIAAQFYYRAVKKIQSEFDGYIYLTEEMKNRISSVKPYIVVEGLADESLFAAPTKASGSESENPPIVMYAGALSKRYGIAELIEAFRQTNLDAQLHIYGFGDFTPELEKIAREDARVCYKGRVSREEILEREREASLLVNVRNPKDEFTAYSFPSKTIEYMASGTPLLTSRLPGIPQEYFEYCYSISGNDVAEIKSALESIMGNSQEVRREMGRRARAYIQNNKTAIKQAERALDFIEHIGD